MTGAGAWVRYGQCAYKQKELIMLSVVNFGVVPTDVVTNEYAPGAGYTHGFICVSKEVWDGKRDACNE